ncbi:MAG: hypothetical protein V1768_01435 [Patescibacteria group bacterium]|nr:hypothetical protein [Patescibacteria group bacterium]MBU1160369.1 hypothetical protein [Patescibacteria group bacterium]MBU1684474.1 hypothetical protein [Patescibacteria group bacterium]MBU1987497.1 hypothetical protein [Patescibacteria group bacterium]
MGKETKCPNKFKAELSALNLFGHLVSTQKSVGTKKDQAVHDIYQE